jgi:hypothetical protein
MLRAVSDVFDWFDCVGFMKAYGFVQAGISLDEFEVRVTTIPNAILACAGLIASFAFVFFGASKNEERVIVYMHSSGLHVYTQCVVRRSSF